MLEDLSLASIVAAAWFTIVGFYAGLGLGAGYQWLCNVVPKKKEWVLPLVLFPSAACWLGPVFLLTTPAAMLGFMGASIVGLGIGGMNATYGVRPRRDR